jgi:hypothetical protein
MKSIPMDMPVVTAHSHGREKWKRSSVPTQSAIRDTTIPRHVFRIRHTMRSIPMDVPVVTAHSHGREKWKISPVTNQITGRDHMIPLLAETTTAAACWRHGRSHACTADTSLETTGSRRRITALH